jgi:hypothetical protein
MLKQLSEAASPLLNMPYIRKTRRNHGLEHATITILSGRFPNVSMAGHSDADGFTLWGDVATEDVERATQEALQRMKQGESHLAVHPNCGTNLVTQGTLVSLAALAGSFGTKRGLRDYWNRLPLVLILSMAAILFGQPLGMQLQEHFTTSGEPGAMQIKEITRRDTSNFSGEKIVTHRVRTQAG